MSKLDVDVLGVKVNNLQDGTTTCAFAGGGVRAVLVLVSTEELWCAGMLRVLLQTR